MRIRMNSSDVFLLLPVLFWGIFQLFLFGCVDGKSTSNLAIQVFSAGSIPGWGMNWVKDQTISGFYHTSSIKRSWVWLQAEYHWLHVIPLKMCRETCYINGSFFWQMGWRWWCPFAFTTRSTWEVGDFCHISLHPPYMGGSKNSGTPKWMVKTGKPYCLIDDLGGKPAIFGNIHIKILGS